MLSHTMTTEPLKAEKDRLFRDEALRWMPEVGRFPLMATRDELGGEGLVQEESPTDAELEAPATSEVHGGCV